MVFIKECFNQIFNLEPIYKDIQSVDEHTFYKALLGDWSKSNENGAEKTTENSDSNINGKPKTDKTCDEVLTIYLKEAANSANREYFRFIFKFVTLFRACINKIKIDQVDITKQTDDKKEFTQLHTAESAPDICNEFITDFMEPKDYFGLDTGELIEVIQHLCYWLYSHNFTTSRLTLL